MHKSLLTVDITITSQTRETYTKAIPMSQTAASCAAVKTFKLAL
jgi:hypothetical protein